MGSQEGWKLLGEVESSSPSRHWPQKASQAAQSIAQSNGFLGSSLECSAHSILWVTGGLGECLDEHGARFVTPLTMRASRGPPNQGFPWVICHAFKPARWFLTVSPAVFCMKDVVNAHKVGSSTGQHLSLGMCSWLQKARNLLTDQA